MDYERYEFDPARLQKRQELIDLGYDPYPYSFEAGSSILGVIEESERRERECQQLDFAATVVGRLWSRREMGKTIFLDLRDPGGKIQLYCSESRMQPETWTQLSLLDLGDIVGVTGTVFRTKRGELSIAVEHQTVLAKTVVPIPIGKEAHERVFYRVSDPELKYRERYVHWLLNLEDRLRITLRSRIISIIRRYMEAEGFLEVSTPTIEFIYGGAEARPFKTNIWALDNTQGFLRISPELYLKRYIVAGFEKVFTVCQNFRNEGIDRSHNPEFTMMEWYEAFTDYEFQMQRFENLVAKVCEEIHGSMAVEYQGTTINFTPPWRRLTMLDALKEYVGLDADGMTAEELAGELARRDIPYELPLSWGLAVAELFAATCEQHLIQPTFVLDHPIDISPLTKSKRGNVRLVERFEPFAYGIEIGNAYSELTDPVEQLHRFLSQREAQMGQSSTSKDYEDNPLDLDFIKAVGSGMPPTGGVGLGIDRIIMILTNAPTIRDIIPFPMLKPRPFDRGVFREQVGEAE